MAGQFQHRMTVRNVTRTRSASGQSRVMVTNGNTFGVRLNTITGLERDVNRGQITTDGTIVQATVRRSTMTNTLQENSYVSIESQDYKITGISKGNFDRRYLVLNLEAVGSIQ